MPKHNSHADAPSHEALLKKSLAAFREPQRLPGGQWRLRVQGAKYIPTEGYDPEGDDPMGVALFTHVPVRPGDNVDTEKVEGGEWRGKRIFTRFDIRDENDAFQLAQVIAAHGISLEDHQLVDGVEACRNRETEATVGLRTFKTRLGETRIENTLTNFAAV